MGQIYKNFPIIIVTFVALLGIQQLVHISESVFASPLWEMWKFSTTRDDGDSFRSCIVYAVSSYSKVTLHMMPSVECYQ